MNTAANDTASSAPAWLPAGPALLFAPWDALEALTELGRARGLGLLELAFSWLAAQPQVASVIAGATRPEQVRQNAAAVHPLTADELAQIDALFPPPAKVALF